MRSILIIVAAGFLAAPLAWNATADSDGSRSAVGTSRPMFQTRFGACGDAVKNAFREARRICSEAGSKLDRDTYRRDECVCERAPAQKRSCTVQGHFRCASD